MVQGRSIKPATPADTGLKLAGPRKNRGEGTLKAGLGPDFQPQGPRAASPLPPAQIPLAEQVPQLHRQREAGQQDRRCRQ